MVAYDRGLELNDLLFKYGARVNSDLLMDLQCDFLPFDVNGSGQFELLPWNYFPVFESKSNHVINKNLGFVSGRFVNSIDTVEAEGIKKRSCSVPPPIPGYLHPGPDQRYGEQRGAGKRKIQKRIYLPPCCWRQIQFPVQQPAFPAMRDSLQKYGYEFMPACG